MPARVPDTLRQRLGADATLALREFVDDERRDWSDDVLTAAADRFECRLISEMAALRKDFNDGLTTVRQELSTTRAEYLKWSFLFWLGQVGVVAVLGFLTRR